MDSNNKIAVVGVRLKGFERPDTASSLEGFLDPGKYIVEEYRQNFPDENSDYVRVRAPALGAGDTWICARWRDQRYADIVDGPTVRVERQLFGNDPLAVPESDLVRLLPEFEDFTYDLDEARYPYTLPGVSLPQAPPKSNNCCTFVEALLVGTWANAHGDFQWSSERHRQMMILSNDDYFSPVTAVIESRMGMIVLDPDAPPHPWTLIQGWRLQWRSGHTFIIVDHHEPTDRVLTLESNSSYKLDGVGFRAIGNLRDFGGRPPPSWWEREELWTWRRVRSTYRYRHQATLRVRDRQWSSWDSSNAASR